MFLMGIFWYHLYDMSNYKLCNLDTYNHNFGSSVRLQCHVLVGGPRKTLYTDMVIAAHAICVRTTMLSLCTIANFLGSQPQDKHNASSNSKMSWRELLSPNAKI